MRRSLFFIMICTLLFCLCACGKEAEDGIWKVESYEKKEDIISIEELDLEQIYQEGVEVYTYKIKYQSDGCLGGDLGQSLILGR